MSEDTRIITPPEGPAGSSVRRTSRQRRPTGAPPPLPRTIAVSTTAWLILAVVVLAGAILVSQHGPSLRVDDRASTWVLRLLARGRTPWLTDLANGIKVVGSGWGVTVIGLAAVALTMIFRRWRHLLVFVCSLFFLEIVGQWIYLGISRPRPYGVPMIASWAGYSAPAPPVAVLTVFLIGIVYCLTVPGRPRSYAKVAITVVIAVFCLARLYLGIDHPGDVILGVAHGVAITVTAFRFFTPTRSFRWPTGGGGPPCRRHRPPRRGHPAGHAGSARADRHRGHAGRPESSVSSTAAPPGGRERTSTCSPSSTRAGTSGRTAGTSCGGPSCTAPWRTSTRSRPCGG